LRSKKTRTGKEIFYPYLNFDKLRVILTKPTILGQVFFVVFHLSVAADSEATCRRD